MNLLVHSLSNEKISSQISIILRFFGPSQCNAIFFKNKHTEYKKNIYNKNRKHKNVLNNYDFININIISISDVHGVSDSLILISKSRYSSKSNISKTVQDRAILMAD